MKRIIVALIVSLSMFSVPVKAQQNICGPGPSIPSSEYPSQTLTVSTTAVGLTVPAGANQALLFFNVNNVRAAYDGTLPTDTVGAILAAGQTQLLCGVSMSRARFIRDDGSDAIVYAVFSGPIN